MKAGYIASDHLSSEIAGFLVKNPIVNYMTLGIALQVVLYPLSKFFDFNVNVR